MQLAQALILLPLGKVNHWRLGYFLFVQVGLYLPRSLTRVVALIDFLSHRTQDRDIDLSFLIIGFTKFNIPSEILFYNPRLLNLNFYGS